MRYSLFLPELIRKGMEHTYPATDRLTTDDMTRACPMGAAKAHLCGYDPDTDSPRWARVKEWLLKTRIEKDRLPDRAEVLNGMELDLHDTERPSMHMTISTLTDTGLMSRHEILDWLEKEFTMEELTIAFGRERPEHEALDKAHAV